MFATKTAAHFLNEFINSLRNPGPVIRALGQGDIVVNIAVSHVPECKQLCFRHEIGEQPVSALQKVFNSRDRNRNIMFLCWALGPLGLGNRMSHSPESLCLRAVLGNDGIEQQFTIRCLQQYVLQQASIAVAGDFQ